ncbi:hypothetical protein PWT90_02802 [Aphanocladium album]|nr:hypothetical protein PWT90_02802 [Aphanocladium album]
MRPVVKNLFLLQITGEQLSMASKARDRTLHPSEDAAFTEFWKQYCICVADSLGFINRNIGSDSRDNILTAMIDLRGLMSTDKFIQVPIWQAQVKGVLDYVTKLGGLAAAVSKTDTAEADRSL